VGCNADRSVSLTMTEWSADAAISRREKVLAFLKVLFSLRTGCVAVEKLNLFEQKLSLKMQSLGEQITKKRLLIDGDGNGDDRRINTLAKQVKSFLIYCKVFAIIRV